MKVHAEGVTEHRDPVLRELVAVGRIARAQGREGEVVVDPLTDFPERFGELDRVFLVDAGVTGEAAEADSRRIESCRMHKGRPVLKLAGVSSIGDAEALRGKELRIHEGELLPLPEGSFYHFQLRGFSVSDRARGDIGVVEDVLSTGGTDLLVVRDASGNEILVPFCEAIVRSVDLPRGRVDIEAPEGLVSLNAD
jgi:16S rRNA processing protein RimM